MQSRLNTRLMTASGTRPPRLSGPTAQAIATRGQIAELYKTATDASVRLGRVLARSKGDMPDGDWTAMLSDTGITASAAQSFINCAHKLASTTPQARRVPKSDNCNELYGKV